MGLTGDCRNGNATAMNEKKIIEKRQELIAKTLSPYHMALEREGISPSLLASKRKEQLTAQRITHRMMEGDTRLMDKGAKAIAKGDRHTLIEIVCDDYAIQQRATEAVEHLLGLAEDRTVVEHRGAVDMTFFPPAPTSVAEWEREYARMAAAKAGAVDDPNAKLLPGGEEGRDSGQGDKE